MGGYILGLATLPAIGLAFLIVTHGWRALSAALERRGWWMAVKVDRKPTQISDYTLRRDIWFERPIGPFFSGHWCRDTHGYGTPEHGWCITRWIGIGNPSGRSVMLYHKRALS